jgi:hypothetical protein
MLFVDDFDKGAVCSDFFARKAGLFINVGLKVRESFFCLFKLVNFHLLIFCFQFLSFELLLGELDLVSEVFSAFFEGLDERIEVV